MSDNDNIVPFGQVIGGKGDGNGDEQKGPPEHDYIVIDVDEEEWFASGFLIFTTEHVAIMHNIGPGAIPVLVVPLHRVKAARRLDEEE